MGLWSSTDTYADTVHPRQSMVRYSDVEVLQEIHWSCQRLLRRSQLCEPVLHHSGKHHRQIHASLKLNDFDYQASIQTWIIHKFYKPKTYLRHTNLKSDLKETSKLEQWAHKHCQESPKAEGLGCLGILAAVDSPWCMILCHNAHKSDLQLEVSSSTTHHFKHSKDFLNICERIRWILINLVCQVV